MNPTLDAFLRSWPFEPGLLLALAAAAGVYARGWRQLHRREPRRWHAGRLLAFLGGLLTLFVALASPLEPFSALLLQVHMAQHLLLMMAAPPLLWLGWPLMPLLRGLPKAVRAVWIAPLFRWRPLRACVRAAVHPAPAFVLFVAATWLWHAPPVYELALRDPLVHYLQHVCFLGTGLLFWFPVVLPYPTRPRWSGWVRIPYLIAADVQNTALSALFTFSPRPLYDYYTLLPQFPGTTPLDDQAAAGVLMWVPGSLAYLVPLFVIGLRLLFSPDRAGSVSDGQRFPSLTLPAQTGGRLALTMVSAAAPAGFDVLRVPLLGKFLKWRHARLALQIPLLLLAALIILDGLTGPQVGAMNLAGVLPWIHWRGLVVLGLLSAGNVFCMACPFMLPRTLARRWLPARLAWPRRLRGKWLAVVLLALFLWAYEAFSLWDRPLWTAVLAISYFAAALVVDGLFRGAAFCKYVCPIGQFHFVQSLASPVEIAVRNPAVCRSCTTKDCIRGRGETGIPGCEMHLFQPRKSSNMDCTFCLDCIHACPHDNVAMAVRPPGAELWRDPQRSGVGRFSRRSDLAALTLLLVFGAFANAAGMVAPVAAWQERLGAALGWQSHIATTSLFYIFILLVAPVVLVAAASTCSRWLGKVSGRWWETATAFAYCLLPLGFGMWVTHYSFHFLTSYDTVIPVAQRFVEDWLGALLGESELLSHCCLPVAAWLLRLEIVFLDLGLLLSLYTGWRIAQLRSERPARALLPWAILLVLLFAVGIWIVFQPMEMRGTMLS